MTDNMELWNSVCQTDPNTTKQVNQRGGFTAICAQSQLKRATELWGPYGGLWGVKDFEYTYLTDKTGERIEVTIDGTFFCPVSEFKLATDMAYKAGNDTCKKLLTDLTTKALSKLGFNSDVFEGLYDDNKYVSEMKQKFSRPSNPKPETTSKTNTAEPNRNQQNKDVFKTYALCELKKYNESNGKNHPFIGTKAEGIAFIDAVLSRWYKEILEICNTTQFDSPIPTMDNDSTG